MQNTNNHSLSLYVNPLLSYIPSKISLQHGLQSAFDHCAPTTKMRIGLQDHDRQPARSPSTKESVKMVPDGVEMVVVFPTTLDSDVVTVDDGGVGCCAGSG
ncbi:hypothetical protein M413DRAFT_29882 [Hebeloma cylindrosporum]|uniref:Uncharacterized protein n=1 Tax=Hebeloma cylindrosporum TaxID=76867 RepID=A0A0C2XLN2_HEBCY|nr:hypothetical protein M413DRAFT_29882 [Hebeloma cylindrosporum h7]